MDGGSSASTSTAAPGGMSEAERQRIMNEKRLRGILAAQNWCGKSQADVMGTLSRQSKPCIVRRRRRHDRQPKLATRITRDLLKSPLQRPLPRRRPIPDLTPLPCLEVLCAMRPPQSVLCSLSLWIPILEKAQTRVKAV